MAHLHSGLLFVEARCTALIAVGGLTELEINERALPPPIAANAFGPAEGPRLFSAVRHQVLDGTLCEVRYGGHVFATFNLCAPLPAAALLLGERVEAERDALLRFLVVTCAPLLSASADPEFAALCFALARAGLPPEAAVVPARALTRPGAAFSLWDVGFDTAGREPWLLIDRGAIRRVGPPRDGVLVLEGAVPPEALLLATPAWRPLALATLGRRGGGGGPPPGLHDLLRRALTGGAAPDKESASRRAVAAAALCAAAGDRRCAVLVREAKLLAPARPRVLDDASRPVGGALSSRSPTGRAACSSAAGSVIRSASSPPSSSTARWARRRSRQPRCTAWRALPHEALRQGAAWRRGRHTWICRAPTRPAGRMGNGTLAPPPPPLLRCSNRARRAT